MLGSLKKQPEKPTPMKNLFLPLYILALLLTGLPSVAQNVGITDKPGGIVPNTQLQVHKDVSGYSPIIQMTNQSTGETAADGVILGIDDYDKAFVTNQVSGGSVYIGTSANNTEIEADGTLKFNGNATVWEDLQMPATAAGAQGGKVPDWADFRGGIKTWAFANNNASSEDELYFTVQIPHAWKEGSAIEPHIHVSPETAPGADQAVVWKLEYVWANYTSAFPASSTTLTATTTVTGSDDHRHLITSFGSITPDANTNKISSVLVCRLYRNSSDAADTYTGRIFLVSLDFHFEKDTEGSRVQYSKN